MRRSMSCPIPTLNLIHLFGGVEKVVHHQFIRCTPKISDDPTMHPPILVTPHELFWSCIWHFNSPKLSSSG
jgi:hypothetical protein